MRMKIKKYVLRRCTIARRRNMQLENKRQRKLQAIVGVKMAMKNKELCC
jgi:hypothetical protein